MQAIRIRMRIDSDTLRLPELLPLLGKKVEIIVLEEQPDVSPTGVSPWDGLYELAGKNVVDPNAYKALRAASMI